MNTDNDARDWCVDEQQSNRRRDTRRGTPRAATRESTDGDAREYGWRRARVRMATRESTDGDARS